MFVSIMLNKNSKKKTADFVSAFPAGITTAATWSTDLAYRRGVAMAEEHRSKGVFAQLGPVAGPLGRTPEGGRNFEGFSPDPVLTGQMMAATIRGMQDTGVVATAKHFIANEQEHFRQVGEALSYGYNITKVLSSNVDDVTMHELYLWPFADAVRAGVGSVLCSYQSINNSHACSNSYTMNKLLKGELGFQGFVQSDWQANQAGVGDILAGLDMSMPGDTLFNSGTSYFGSNLTIAVLNGTIPEWRVDDMAVRIMAAYYKVGRDKIDIPINFNSWTSQTYGYKHAYAQVGYGVVNQHVNSKAGHAPLIRDIGVASTVLLKNVNDTLPLTGKERQVGIFGEDAGPNPDGVNSCADRGCNKGTLAMGWGSGTVNFPYLITPYEAIQRHVVEHTNGSVFALLNNAVDVSSVASNSDVCLTFANADSGEAYIAVGTSPSDTNQGDRRNLTLWKGGDELIRHVASSCSNTVVIIHSVGPVLVDEWAHHPNVTALLWAGLPGEQSGNALVDVLYGVRSPAGKSPFTWGKKRQDWDADVMYKPNNGRGAPQQDFNEGLLIDYRAFDARGINPTYEFGFGLSYTTFNYSDLSVSKLNAPPYTPATGQTPAAIVLGNTSHNAADYLFPSAIVHNKIKGYIYPYLNTTDLRAASSDSNYGMNASTYIPPHATDGRPQPVLPAGGAPGGNPRLYDELATVNVTVKNTGHVVGDEVAQVYVSVPWSSNNSTTARRNTSMTDATEKSTTPMTGWNSTLPFNTTSPPRVLRAFERLSNLQPGEARVWSVNLTRRDFARWDVVAQDWRVPPGKRMIWVGGSSRVLPVWGEIVF